MGSERRPVARAHEHQQILLVNLVAVDEDATAHDVKQNVGEMVGVGERFGRPLQAVGGSHIFAENGRCRPDIGFKLLRQGRAVCLHEPVAQPDDIGAVLVNVGDDIPLPRFPWAQRQPRVDKVGAGLTLQVVFGRERPAAAEGRQLLGTEQVAVGRQTGLPDNGGHQRLAGFSAVGERRGHGIDAQPGGHIQLTAFVGVEQVALHLLQAGGDPVGQHILQTVQQHYPAGVAIVLQPARFDEAKTVAGAPDRAPRQIQVMVDLFKDEGTARKILIKMTFAPVEAGVALGEGFPEMGTTVSGHLQQRGAAHPVGVGHQLIFRLIGEEGRVGVGTTGSEAAVAGDEQPVVGAADQAHEKGRHLVHVCDAIEGLAVDLHILAPDRLVLNKQARVVEVNFVSKSHCNPGRGRPPFIWERTSPP